MGHPWRPWVPLIHGQCDETRSCERCGEEQRRKNHLWDVWQFESPTSCAQVRFCRRCSEGKERKEPTRAEEHDLKSSDLPKESCTSREGRCPRCNQWVFVWVEDHEWGPWQGPAGRRVRVCQSCRKTEAEG